ncbi:hypothetical protein HY024_03770 [Candidatus Curtissbacteria bacterium]|nr:hypothetical protein [Candidatus Curtissbacteria bacterium]
MSEKCIYPTVVEQSAGRATCPPNMQQYREQDRCIVCPKVKMSGGRFRGPSSDQKALVAANDIIYAPFANPQR